MEFVIFDVFIILCHILMESFSIQCNVIILGSSIFFIPKKPLLFDVFDCRIIVRFVMEFGG